MKGTEKMIEVERETVWTVPCRMCNEGVAIAFDIADYQRWRGGEFIQDVMPYLTADERKMLISQTCGKCWEKMFPED
jgi:hypothetical protein